MTEGLPAVEHSLRKEMALVLSMIGAALGLVGLVSTAWARPDHNQADNPIREVGLWKYCVWPDPEDTTPRECFTIDAQDTPGWFEATQILCSLGLVLHVVTLTLTIVSECALRCRHNLAIVFAFVSTGFIATVFGAASLLVFCSHVQKVVMVTSESLQKALVAAEEDEVFTYQVSWAFVLTGVSAGMQPMAAILGVWDASLERRKKRLELVTLNNNNEGDSPRGFHPYETVTS